MSKRRIPTSVIERILANSFEVNELTSFMPVSRPYIVEPLEPGGYLPSIEDAARDVSADPAPETIEIALNKMLVQWRGIVETVYAVFRRKSNCLYYFRPHEHQ